MSVTSDRIKEAMSLRGVTQSELSEKTKIGKSSISTYLKGAYEPKQRNLYKIAQVLDVDPVWLMGGDVPMQQEAGSSSVLTPDPDLDGFQFALMSETKDLNETQQADLLKFAKMLKAYDEEKKK